MVFLQESKAFVPVAIAENGRPAFRDTYAQSSISTPEL